MRLGGKVLALGARVRAPRPATAASRARRWPRVPPPRVPSPRVPSRLGRAAPPATRRRLVRVRVRAGARARARGLGLGLGLGG